MKRSILATVLLGSALTLAAKDFVVVDCDGNLGSGLEYVYWYQGAVDYAQPAPDGSKALKFTVSNAAADGSCGLRTMAGNDYIGQLAEANFQFDWYANTVGQTVNVRLAVDGGVQKDYVISVTEDNVNKWNIATFEVSEFAPEVAKGWQDYAKDGAAYVLGVHTPNAEATSAVYFRNVRYTNLDETWTKPAVQELPVPTTVPQPAHAAADVVSLFGSAYPQATAFGIGSWGQSSNPQEMEIDGKKVMKVKYFNYLGWEFAKHLDLSGCNMMHVDWFAANEGNFGFTPISPGKEAPWVASEIKVGEWNSYDVPLSHWSTVDFKDVFQLKFDQGNGSQEGYIANVYFYKDSSVVEPTYELGAHFFGNAEKTLSVNGKDYIANIAYELIANEDKTLTVNATIEGLDGIDGLVRQMHVYSDQWPSFTQVEGDDWTVTSIGTFEPGFAFPDLFFWFPYAGGAARIDVAYTFGAANEKPVTVIAPKLKDVEVADITATSAVVKFSVALPEEIALGSVDVLLNDKVIATNPKGLVSYNITDLAPLTEYTYALKAFVHCDGDTYESKPVEVKFRTLRDGSQAAVYHAITDWMVPNAFLPGETEADKRSIPVSIEATLTYNPDMTMTVDATFHGNLPVGLVPAITLRGKFDRKDMTRIDDTHYTITTTGVTYEPDEAFDYLYFFLKYAGGDTGNNPAINGYKAGMTNDPVAYGEPASVIASISKESFKVGDTALCSAVVADANGHYLFDTPVVFSVAGTAFTVDGSKVTADAKGASTLTATAGELSAEIVLSCLISAEAKSLVDSSSAVDSDNENWNLAFDGNEGTQVEWAAGDDNHFIEITLEQDAVVECIELVWEGASAADYTLTLTPERLIARAAENDADYDVVNTFTVTDGQGGAGMVVRKTFARDDFAPMKAKSIRLETSKAATPWGIKLKEMKVMGHADFNTGISFVDGINDNAPVEYFNLQGVRVSNPDKGIYIRRQGNKVEKIVL